MKGLLAVVFVLLCAGSYFFIKIGLPMLLHEMPVADSKNPAPNSNLNTNNQVAPINNTQALISANKFEVAPLEDIDDKKYHNFFENGIIKDGNLYRWHKTDLTYYIDRLAARRLSDSKIRRAFDWWSHKSKLFTFTRVTDPERADIFIQVATASEKDRMGEAGPDKEIIGKTYNFKGNTLQENIINHATVTIAEEYFSAKQVDEYNRSGKDHGFQTLVHELGHVLGLMGHSPNAGECMYFQADATGKACDIMTPEINTLAVLYGRSDILTRGFYDAKRT